MGLALIVESRRFGAAEIPAFNWKEYILDAFKLKVHFS